MRVTIFYVEVAHSDLSQFILEAVFNIIQFKRFCVTGDGHTKRQYHKVEVVTRKLQSQKVSLHLKRDQGLHTLARMRCLQMEDATKQPSSSVALRFGKLVSL